jgi:iron complex transport system substrate-binding protein
MRPQQALAGALLASAVLAATGAAAGPALGDSATVTVTGPAVATSAPITITDPTGRRLELPGPPARVISLVPSVTEILFALGADDLLVGVTTFCDYPLAARQKPVIGSMLDPSLETIVALRPDLVVATRAGNRHETFEQLVRLGLPVYLVDPTSLPDATELIARLAELVGRRRAGAALLADLDRRVRAVTERVAGRPRPRVLYVLWPDPLIVPGRHALVTDLIARAGGESVTAAAGEAYPRWSVEAAIARAPEVIMLARHGAGIGHPVAREKWDRLTSLPAIRSGRIHEVHGDVLHRYGPRVVGGLEILARLIHPEAFREAARP